MKKKLVFATNNAHKLDEISSILGEKVELLSLKDINCHVDIPETADTLEGNAMLKAEYIFKNYGLDCFADDTGLGSGSFEWCSVVFIPPVMPEVKDTMRKPICKNYCRICRESPTEKHNSAQYLPDSGWKEAFVRRNCKR